ncbi:MAG: apolipoprotein N-acyltransferase [Pseudomonadota bacterium]
MFRFSRSGWRRLAGVVASALLFGLYARGGNAYIVGFVALVPWLLALDAERGACAALRSGWTMSVAFAAAVFAWFGVAVATYTGLGATTGIVALLAAAPLMQPQLLVFALVRERVGRRHGALVRAFAGASAWTATEWLLPKLLDDTLGHGLFPSYPLRQFADVGGAAGLTFLLILCNEAIAAAIATAQRGEGPRATLRPLALAVAVPALLAGYGTIRLAMLPPATGETLRAGMVQSNIFEYERLRREMGAYAVVRHVLDTHYGMSQEAIDLHRVDALLWAETVYPTTFGHPKSPDGAQLDAEIRRFVDTVRVPLVFGTYDIDDAGEYNAAAIVEPGNGLLGFYRKTNPFPLTEYVPPWLDGPTFRRILPWAGRWRAGDGARVFPLRVSGGREIPILPMICLDDVDTMLAVDGARLGAQVIVGMSNDSWFTAHPVGADLHLAVAAFRSIETRMPQLRVTTNGVSATIDATGTLLAATAMGERRLLIGEVQVGPPPKTLMVLWGDWVGRTGLIALLLLFAFDALRRRTAAADGADPGTTAVDADVPTPVAGPWRAEAVVLSPAWRIAAAALRVFARGSLLWMGLAALQLDPAQTNPLSQIRLFAALFVAPEIAAWALLRAFAATVRIEGDALVLDSASRRIEIPIREIAGVAPWRLPLPGAGLDVRLASGRRWSHGIAIADPRALIEALHRAGGATTALAEAAQTHAVAWARVRASAKRRWFDHPVLKFVVFPLVPALPAFRLHQYIAYGGTFGEYHAYGLKAYLVALGLWWASWAIGLLLFAAALRVVIELGTLLALASRPQRATEARRWLERLGRLLFYVGVPAFLAIRLLSG